MDDISSGDWEQSWNGDQDRLINDQTHEFLVFATVLHPDIRFSTLVNDLEGVVFDIGLHFSIGESATDETLRIEDTGEGDQFIDRPIVIRRQRWRRTHVFCGFIASRFFAA
jgi:hypothetical protein